MSSDKIKELEDRNKNLEGIIYDLIMHNKILSQIMPPDFREDKKSLCYTCRDKHLTGGSSDTIMYCSASCIKKGEEKIWAHIRNLQ